MSLKDDIEKFMKLANAIAKLYKKKIDSDMTFLLSIKDNPGYLENKIPSIREIINNFTDLLLGSNLLSIYHHNHVDGKKIKDVDKDKLLIIIDSIDVPTQFFYKLFSGLEGRKSSPDVNNEYEQIYSKIKELIDGMKEKLEIKGNDETDIPLMPKIKKCKKKTEDGTTICGYKTSCALVHMDGSLKYMCKYDTPEDITELVGYMDIKNLPSKMSVYDFAIRLGLNSEYLDALSDYTELQKHIREYFGKQNKKYLSSKGEKIDEIVGNNDVMFLDDYNELDELDVECVDNLITIYINELNNIRDDEALERNQERILSNIESAKDKRYLERKSLKEKIESHCNNIVDSLDSVQSYKTMIYLDFVKDGKMSKDQLAKLNTILKDNVEELQKIEEVFDDVAMSIRALIKLWQKLIGPDTTYCIIHTYTYYSAIIGPEIFDVLADKRFGEDLKEENEQFERLQHPDILPSYDGKIKWDNIRRNIESLL